MQFSGTFVGRIEEVATLQRAVASDGVVCVIGAAGVGKSRLVAEAFPDAAWVDARQLDAADLRRAVSAADGDVVVVDGLDRLIGADEAVGLPDATSRTLVVTAREPLRARGVTAVWISGLEQDEAEQLFVERAREADPSFAVDERSRVTRLVAALDRNPLAIELAALRVRTANPAELLRRLEHRFRLLRDRHTGRSLEEALALSWDLLGRSERSCLVQCSVFEGGFDLAAAEAVVELEDAGWTLDVVESLVDKSVVERADSRLRLSHSMRAFVGERQPPGDEIFRRHARYFGSLATVFDARTATAEEIDTLAVELKNLKLALQTTSDESPLEAARLGIVADRIAQYRLSPDERLAITDVASKAADAADDDGVAAAIGVARAEALYAAGRLEDAGAEARRAADLSHPDHELVRVRAHVTAAEVERRTGSPRTALERLERLRESDIGVSQRFVEAHLAGCLAELGRLEEARALAMQIAPPGEVEPAMEYAALKRLAYTHYYLGNLDHQELLNEQARVLATRIGDRRRIAQALQGLGDAAFARGDYAAVKEFYGQASSLHRELGNDHLEAVLLGNLGSAEHRLGELGAAAEHYEQSLRGHRRLGTRPYEAVVTYAFAVLEHERGQLDDAAFRYDQALELFAELQQDDDVVGTLLCRAWLEFGRDRYDRAAEFLGRAEDLADEGWWSVVASSRRLIEGVDVIAEPDPGNGFAKLLSEGLEAVIRGQRAERTGELQRTLQGRLVLWLAATGGQEPTDTTAEPPREPSRGSSAELVIGDGGDWFQIPGEDVVNLRRRRAHRLILDRLAQLHAEGPDATLDVYDAFDVGWPGETVSPETAAERVYWVVGSLRKLGLEDVLLTSDAGYYLAPSVVIKRIQNS